MEEETNAFAVSIALMLIFDLDPEQGEFGVENMDGRMSQKSMLTYEALPKRYRTPILAGIDLLKSRSLDEFE